MHRAVAAVASGVSMHGATLAAAVVVGSIKANPSSVNKIIVLLMTLATYHPARIKALWSRLLYPALDFNFRAFDSFQ